MVENDDVYEGPERRVKPGRVTIPLALLAPAVLAVASAGALYFRVDILELQIVDLKTQLAQHEERKWHEEAGREHMRRIGQVNELRAIVEALREEVRHDRSENDKRDDNQQQKIERLEGFILRER